MNIYGHTANMVDIDTRTVLQGRYFTDSEERPFGARLPDRRQRHPELLSGTSIRSGKVIRIANAEYTVIGTFEKIGSVLGQDQDNFVMIPLNPFFRLRPRFSLTLEHSGAGRTRELRTRAG